jgi:hypothetical protein
MQLTTNAPVFVERPWRYAKPATVPLRYLIRSHTTGISLSEENERNWLRLRREVSLWSSLEAGRSVTELGKAIIRRRPVTGNR